MSNKSNYPDGSFNDPSAPWNLEDITETDAFADKRDEIINERVKDALGYVPESFGEADDGFWIGFSALLLVSGSDDIDRLIGAYIRRMVIAYCTPSDSDVIEVLEADHE